MLSKKVNLCTTERISGGRLMIKNSILLLMIIVGSLTYGGELKEALFAGGCFFTIYKWVVDGTTFTKEG